MERIGLPGLISQLFQNAVDVAKAEVRLARAKAFARMRMARTGLILLGIAAVVSLAALVGLVVGVVLALVPLVGALAAGGIVLVTGLVIAGLLGWIAIGQLSGQSAIEAVTPGAEQTS